MTEVRLEDRLRGLYREEPRVAPAELRLRVAAIPDLPVARRPHRGRAETLLVAALLAIALAVATLVAGAGQRRAERLTDAVQPWVPDACAVLAAIDAGELRAGWSPQSQDPGHGCVLGWDDRYAVPHLTLIEVADSGASGQAELAGTFGLDAWSTDGPDRWVASGQDRDSGDYFAVAVRHAPFLVAVTADSRARAADLADRAVALLAARMETGP